MAYITNSTTAASLLYGLIASNGQIDIVEFGMMLGELTCVLAPK